LGTADATADGERPWGRGFSLRRWWLAASSGEKRKRREGNGRREAERLFGVEQSP
jgi:hypothetical protein